MKLTLQLQVGTSAAKWRIVHWLLVLAATLFMAESWAQGVLTNINSGPLNSTVTLTQPQQGPTINIPQTSLNLNLSLGASRYGQTEPSSVLCGGLVNGKPKPPCPAIPATFEGNAVGDCPAGTFPDIGAGGCYSCPNGYTRTSEAVDTARACTKADASVKSAFVAAKKAGSACAKGFFDPIRDGECWSCPEGYRRSAAHIEAPNACYIPAGDNFVRANWVKKTPWPHECTSGSFHDAFDGGACWTCPAGYSRTGEHVADVRACSKAVPEQVSRAKLEGVRSCREGEVFDPRNGGECWACPTATTRSVFPIHEGKACERWAGYAYSKATLVSKWSCGTGAFLDLIPSSDSRVMARIRTQYGSAPIPPSLGNNKGGTCWSCPTGRERTTAAVYTDAACSGPLVVWQPGPWRTPGLFGLDGAEAVVMELIKERKLIETVAVSQAAVDGKKEGVAIQDAWTEIITNPAGSSILNLAVYSRVVAAASNPAQASPAERRLLASFAEASRAFKEYQAQTALDAYDAWNAAVVYERGQAAKKNVATSQWGEQGLSDVPDFEQIAVESVVTSVGAGVAGVSVTVAGRLAVMAAPVRKAIFPSFKTERLLVKRGFKDAPKAFEKAAAKTFGKVFSKVMSSALKEGPQAVIGTAIDLAIEGAVRLEQIANARPRLLARLAETKQPLDIGRLLLTDEGANSVTGMWIHAMGGESAPRNPPAIVAAAQSSVQAQHSTALSSGYVPNKVTTPSKAKVDGAITKQIDAADVQGHALVELLTVVASPNALTPVNLKAPGNVVLVASSQDASGCPANAANATQCRQRFTLRLDTRNNGCALNGDYMAEFQVGCQPNAPAAQCSPGTASIPFRLTGSTACTKR